MSIPVPADYRLARDVCSYGYFLLEPNNWSPATGTFTTTLDLGTGAVTLRVRQTGGKNARGKAGSSRPPRCGDDDPGPGHAGRPLSITADRVLTASERAAARAALVRMLRLDEDAGLIASFHTADPRFAASGRGRLMRSATLFEDILKTVTSCNVTWPSTIIMNRKLCRVFGRRSGSGLHAFPSAARIARARPQTLRARCSVGYRDARIVELARIYTRAARTKSADARPAWLRSGDVSDEELLAGLLDLPGIGPYAAANIMQLMGRYAHLPLDTESIRHGRTVMKLRGGPRQVMKRVQRHFEPFGEHRFRSYWFELWRYYELKRGPAWTWERDTIGKTFTAALLK